MKFSENWLREWVNPSIGTETLCEQLTMAGLEVDSVTPAAPVLEQVVVGRITATEQHPDADALLVCTVDVGATQPLNIVCGAPNAATGLLVAVATVGASLPGGVRIKQSEIRGVPSHGMLCSAAEVGLSDEHEGLLSLDATAVPGTPLAQHLDLQDQIIEIDLTPNRGDCLSLRGVAREVGVANRAAVNPPVAASAPDSHGNEHVVRIEAQAACSAYAGRIINGLDIRARTPDWLRERLRRGGIRPKSPVVDVTNYVMLELGQPMHAFDCDALQGPVTVRFAQAGEQIVLLDGGEETLDGDTLVIADDSGPIALAGIMGGAKTAVQRESTSVFLESACFVPAAVTGMGRRYKRHTDALHRFERGVDPALQSVAIERATALILEIAGGQAGPVTLAGASKSAAQAIVLRHARVSRLLGSDIPAAEITDILERLDMRAQLDGDCWRVTPPSFRYDITQEADLIEEVARVHGYNRLPARTQQVPAAIVPQPEQELELQRLREILLQRGYNEAITYSFVDANLQQQLTPQTAPVDVDNPIAEQYAQMRTTLWSSLLPAWEYNARRQAPRVRLFEIGLRFARDAAAPLAIAQRMTCAGVISGSVAPEHWDQPIQKIDLFDVKGHVQALFAYAGDVAPKFEAAQHPALHPGRCARIVVDSACVGWLGQLHPEFSKTYGNKELPYLFELDCEYLLQARLPRYKSISDFPWVRRDLAVVVPDAVSAGALETLVEEEKPEHLQSVKVFDVFRGQDLETGCKSIALGLIFQDKSSTLTDKGVDEAVALLTERLEERCGAKVRGR